MFLGNVVLCACVCVCACAACFPRKSFMIHEVGCDLQMDHEILMVFEKTQRISFCGASTCREDLSISEAREDNSTTRRYLFDLLRQLEPPTPPFGQLHSASLPQPKNFSRRWGRHLAQVAKSWDNYFGPLRNQQQLITGNGVHQIRKTLRK